MRPSVGTVAELAKATGTPVRTLQRWAARGLITRVGTTWPPRYDVHQVMRIKARRTLHGKFLPR